MTFLFISAHPPLKRQDPHYTVCVRLKTEWLITIACNRIQYSNHPHLPFWKPRTEGVHIAHHDHPHKLFIIYYYHNSKVPFKFPLNSFKNNFLSNRISTNICRVFIIKWFVAALSPSLLYHLLCTAPKATNNFKWWKIMVILQKKQRKNEKTKEILIITVPENWHTTRKPVKCVNLFALAKETNKWNEKTEWNEIIRIKWLRFTNQSNDPEIAQMRYRWRWK